MPIEFKCQHCGKQLRTPDNSAGKQGRCPHCQNLMQIPLASEAQHGDAATDPFHDVLGPTQKPAAAPLQDDLFGGSGSQDPLGGAASMPQAPQVSGFAGGPTQSSNPYSSPTFGGAAGYGRGSYRPHRGAMVLTLGIISLVAGAFGALFSFCCCAFAFIGWVADVVAIGLAVPAAILGHLDLKAMSAGKMDPSGRGMTQAGFIMGIIAGVIAILALLLSAIYFIFVLGLQMTQNPPPF